MSRKYKFCDSQKIYFISFATVYFPFVGMSLKTASNSAQAIVGLIDQHWRSRGSNSFLYLKTNRGEGSWIDTNVFGRVLKLSVPLKRRQWYDGLFEKINNAKLPLSLTG